ncbi:MAG: choice-of-anchor P family protein [Bryobacteraceae bacterium]
MRKDRFFSLCLPVTSLFVVSLVAAAGTARAQEASTAASPTQCRGFAASAYGTTAFVGRTITSGKTAPVSIGNGCGTTKIGASQTGTVLSVSDLPTITTAIISTTAASTANSATATSDVHQISLLGGLITAQELKAVSTTSLTSTGFHVSATGTTFIKLVVFGNAISATAPNTTISLPGIGRVVLNEQSSLTGVSQASLTVNMIHVYVTLANVLGIQVGTQIIVADAHSGVTVASGPALLDGTAYGSVVNGTILRSSPTAPENMPCQGTNGAVLVNSVLSVSVPPALLSGTVRDTVKGSVTEAGSAGETTSTIQALKLLGSLVTADTIKADAHASTTDGTNFTFNDSGSLFVNLKVSGFAGITANVAPNTKLTVAGVGTLYLHRVITTGNNIEVRMIELVINQANTFGLPLGTDIRVAVASASLHSAAKP